MLDNVARFQQEVYVVGRVAPQRSIGLWQDERRVLNQHCHGAHTIGAVQFNLGNTDPPNCLMILIMAAVSFGR